MWIKDIGTREQFINLFRMAGGFVSSKKDLSRYRLPSAKLESKHLLVLRKRKMRSL